MGFTMNFSGHSEYPTCTLLGALMVHFSYLGRTERGPMGTGIACKRKAITSRDYVFLGYTGRGGQTRSDKPISDTGVYLLFKHYCQVVGAGTHAPPHLRPGDSDHKASCRRYTSQASAGVFKARKYSDGGMVR